MKCVALLVLLCLPPRAGLAAQGREPIVGRVAVALGAERRGDSEAAADGFFAVLREHPDNSIAVLGLSRVLPVLDRRIELMAPLGRAIISDSTNTTLLALAVRNWSLLGNPDSAAKYVDRWATLVEGEEEPFREWAVSALEVRDRKAARRALETGRARINNPAALAPELAQLHQAEGDVAGAANEWLRAVTNAPTYRASAVLLLGSVLPAEREAVLTALERSDTDEARRLHGLLRLGWGEPQAGLAELAEVVPASVNETAVMVHLVLDQLKNRTDPAALGATAGANELLASRQSGESRVRSWMAAARAWADAGSEDEARRVLALIASDPAAPTDVATNASNTLFGVLIAEGAIEEAEKLFIRLEPKLTLDERDLDRRRLALGWAMRGEFDSAERVMAKDSSVAGYDVRGRVHALAGELGLASEWLRLAGPYADEQLQVVERVRLLSLIKAIGVDSLPAFGDALRKLAGGDTTTAVTKFGALAEQLPGAGAAALGLFAGELALSIGDTTRALALARGVDSDSAAAAAPAARLLRARVLVARGEDPAARSLLESLILDFPASAVIPEARRMRDLLLRTIPPGTLR